jgi:hypothetical protein
VGGELSKASQTGHRCISAKLVYYLIMPPREWALKEKDVSTSEELTMAKADILQCVQAIESKLAELRRVAEQLPAVTESTSDSSSMGPLPTVQFVDKTRLRRVIAQAFAEMGIHGAPIGAEKVQEMIAACGVQPEANAFSQGIIETREE